MELGGGRLPGQRRRHSRQPGGFVSKAPIGARSFAYACRGPVCDPEDGETIRELCTAARALALTRRAVALRMDPDIPVENRTFARILRTQGFRPKEGANRDQIQPRLVYRLELAGQTEETLLASFHPKTRYNIGLARRRGVEVRLCGAGQCRFSLG